MGFQIPNLAQIYLVGFYEEREFAIYVSSISNELRIPVRLYYYPAYQCSEFYELLNIGAHSCAYWIYC